MVGRIGVLSFNGNKIITTGGGGMILTKDEQMARLVSILLHRLRFLILGISVMIR